MIDDLRGVRAAVEVVAEVDEGVALVENGELGLHAQERLQVAVDVAGREGPACHGREDSLRGPWKASQS